MPAMLPRPDPALWPDARLRPVPDAPIHPAVQRVLDAAARKGVTLEVTVFDESTHTAVEAAAAAVGAELGQIVKSLVFVVPGDGRSRAASCASSPVTTGSTSPGWRRSPARPTSAAPRPARRTT